MDYKRIYDSLIDRGRNRTFDGYGENHHIIPRCMNGSDNSENLVKLTPEEHYVVHQLLVKIYPHNSKLIYAATLMTAKRSNNKIYGWLRRRSAIAFKKMHVEKQPQKGEKNSQYGTICIFNEELRENRRIKNEEPIPEGWKRGLRFNWDSWELKLLKKQNRIKEIELRKELRIQAIENKNEERELRIQAIENKNKKHFQELWNKFISGEYLSIRDFVRRDYDKSVVYLAKSWKKYIPEYAEFVRQGKSFNGECRLIG